MKRLRCGWVLLLVICAPVMSVAEDSDPANLFSYSIEELLDVEVYSVTKTLQRAADSAAAVYVVSAEDIRRIGATSIPAALRVVPGIHVAQINAHTWAITVRGFNGAFSNRLLVLVDGLVVYTPMFSGVFWDELDIVMADIERIEVIRGPGATIWGSNAVNGIINVITKNAAETQGGLAQVGIGVDDNHNSVLRWGGQLGEDVSYRVFGKARDTASLDRAGEDSSNLDGYDSFRTGFRIDSVTEEDRWRIQGGVYRLYGGESFGNLSLDSPEMLQPAHRDYEDLGMNILGNWEHSISADSKTTLQLFFDRTNRELHAVEFVTNTADADFHHSLQLSEYQSLIYGVGLRVVNDHLDEIVPDLGAADNSRTNTTVSGFVQTDVAFLEDTLVVSLGSKFEHYDPSGFEYQPSVRAFWRPVEHHGFWGAVSRAVRTPSRVNTDVLLDVAVTELESGEPAILRFVGNRDVEANDLLAYELGYRFTGVDGHGIDIATFYNIHNDSTSNEPGMPFFENERAIVPARYSNEEEAQTWGVETSISSCVTEWMRLNVGYTYFNFNDYKLLKESPNHQFNARSYIDLSDTVQFDTMVYYVDDIVSGSRIEGYTRIDFRLGWQPAKGVDLGLALRNAFDEQHREFGDTEARTFASEIERSVYGQIRLAF